MPRAIISLTSIPRRFDTTLPKVIDNLKRQSTASEIVVSLPSRYAKWGAATPPRWIEDDEAVTVFHPSTDHGPATKLLGGLEFARSRPDIEYVITCDDDIELKSPRHIEHLLRCAEMFPGCIVTIGGIELLHPPFRNGNGLGYSRKLRTVHAPAGFKCVVYPAALLRDSPVPFELRQSLPEGVFHDDDAYFGVMAGAMGIPVIAVPGKGTRCFDGDGGSGVEEKQGKDRRDTEAEIFTAAVEKGFLTVPAVQLPISLSKKLNVVLSYLQSR